MIKRTRPQTEQLITLVLLIDRVIDMSLLKETGNRILGELDLSHRLKKGGVELCSTGGRMLVLFIILE